MATTETEVKMSARREFAHMAAKRIGDLVAQLGHMLREKDLPVPASYSLGCSTRWYGRVARVTIDLNTVSVTREIKFDKSYSEREMAEWFTQFAESLWSQYLE